MTRERRQQRSFIAKWWLLIPLIAGSLVWWVIFFGQVRKLWAALFV